MKAPTYVFMTVPNVYDGTFYENSLMANSC